VYGLFLIVVLVIVGGAIAFIGDRLGSRVGKKKLTIFGLRPRHTSILVTILTGISITTMTLAVMATVSENVRTALFGMEQLRHNMGEMENRLAYASQELEKAKGEQAKTDETLLKTRSDLEQLMDQRRELEQRADELQRGNDALEAAKAELMTENSSLTLLNQDLEEDNAKLAGTNRQLEERNDSLTAGIQIMREGDIAFRAGEVLSSGVVQCGRTQEETMKDLRALTDIARENIAARLGDKASEQEKQIWVLESDYEYASKVISESKVDMVVRVASIGNLVRGEDVRTVLQLYRNKRVFNDGELIATKAVHINVNKENELNEAMTGFLRNINLLATQRGVLADPISGNVGTVEGEEIYDAIDALRTARGNATIYAYAKGACDVLGPLRIKLKIIASGVVGAF